MQNAQYSFLTGKRGVFLVCVIAVDLSRCAFYLLTYTSCGSCISVVSALVVATVLALRFGRRVLQTILEVRKQ